MENKKIYLHSNLRGQTDNPVAQILKTMVWIVWLGGGIIGLISAFSKGTLGIVVALIVWLSAFVMGIFPYALAEIITLLHHTSRKEYYIEYKDFAGIEYKSIDSGSGAINRRTVNHSIPERNTKQKVFDINHNDKSLPFILKKAMMETSDQDQAKLSIMMNTIRPFLSVEAIMADITIENKIGDPYRQSNIVFTGFHEEGNKTDIWSERSMMNMPISAVTNIGSITVVPKEYYINDKKYIIGEDNYFLDEGSSGETIESLMVKAKEFKTAKEIYQYVETLARQNDPIAAPELLDMLKTSANYERLYGNGHDACIKKMNNYFYGEDAKQEIRENKDMMQDDSRKDDDENNSALDSVFCINCGTKIEETDSEFCPTCGTKLIK